MTHVYVVLHVHTSQDGDEEDLKIIGVYRTREGADAAVARLRLQPGFRDHPEGFEVSEYELDKDEWTEGFISWSEGLEPIEEVKSPPRD